MLARVSSAVLVQTNGLGAALVCWIDVRQQRSHLLHHHGREPGQTRLQQSHHRNGGRKQGGVQGSIAYFGTYSVGKPDKSYTAKVEGSTFPNWAGETQKRIAAIPGDELTITNSSGSAGGIAGSKWKRVK
jgi:Lipocalin-like domain